MASPQPESREPDPTAPPTRAPPAAAAAELEEEEEEWVELRPRQPVVRMKVAPYAFHVVFSSMGRTGDILGGAFGGLILLNYVVKFLSISPDADRARFWGFVSGVLVAIYLVATACVIGVFVRYHMDPDGIRVLEYRPPAEEDQVPPPPTPGMDMC